MKKHTALVLGGQGIIGRNLIHYLERQEHWQVKAVSRRAPSFDTTAEFHSIDLLDPNAIAAYSPWLADITHIFYAAYQEYADTTDQRSVNLGMLRNIVEAVERDSDRFRHIGFIQGGKAYGAHFGMYKTPAKETDPRHFPPNFYYDQEDYLRDASKGKRWSWTALRPDIVFGFAVGNPMNLGNVLAVYASLCKELGVPLRFPGTPTAYGILANGTSASLFARAMEWAALNEVCYGEIFNITNGDVFRWSQVFPKIAAAFGIDCVEPQTFSLTEAMRDKGLVWDAMVKKYGLQPNALNALANWQFGDFIFKVEVDAFFDVNKARRFGFHEMNLDTGEEILKLIGQLKEQKIIPC
ncbi:SDR family oxidoreductase [Microcoleus sp. MON1_C5]|jgi:nucleoside-diphosphate-sugar epimerase|uniref:SDR family oxidoreductase n=1 Tax=Microcoleus sp. MON1_C5 TaxID=2818828 RepID=UPI002FD7325C